MPIALLIQLASVVPFLAKYLNAPESAQKVADAVGGVASQLTGATNPEEAVKQILANAEMKQKFIETATTQQIQWDLLFLQDVQSARARDVEIRKAGQKNQRAEWMFVLAVIVIVGLVWMIWTRTDISEFVKGVITLVLGRFLGYLDSIYSFEFGSTRSSKEKDATISGLTKQIGES
jgi:hypothetical protein